MNGVLSFPAGQGPAPDEKRTAENRPPNGYAGAGRAEGQAAELCWKIIA